MFTEDKYQILIRTPNGPLGEHNYKKVNYFYELDKAKEERFKLWNQGFKVLIKDNNNKYY